MEYHRPIVLTDAARPPDALALGGGWAWFERVEVLRRDAPPRLAYARDLPSAVLDRLTRPRPSLHGIAFDRPRLMGIVNVTPDSFSDGGLFLTPDAAVAQARALADAGAAILDIGGESTRPGAAEVAVPDEIARITPVIAALRGIGPPLSVDTRKAAVAEAALSAGAAVVNDVSALTFDPGMAALVARRGAPVVLMHAQGTPATMQADPRYDDVLLDVYDWLSARIDAAVAAGIDQARIIVDPGIGFGKTQAHNLALLRGLSLFHGLGCPILLGASRKRFIGMVGGETGARLPGSLAVALMAAGQGVQILRVHDVDETRAALALWAAVTFQNGTFGDWT